MKVLLDGTLASRGEAPLVGRLGSRFPVTALPGGAPAEERRRAYADTEVAVAMTWDRAMPPAPALRLLQLPVSGLDAVVLDAVPPQVAVCNVYEHEIAIAEYVLAGMLEWTIGLAGRSGRFRAGDWSDSPRVGGPTRGELAGATVGLVGYGHIGQAVALRARSFGMQVEAVTRTPRPLDPAPDRLGGYGDLGGLLERADFVVVACALDEATRGLLDAAQLARMKPSAVLLNVARGPIVDETALFEALRDRRLLGAVLDVWYAYATPAEPDVRPSRHPFQQLDNVVMTPHLSGWSDGAQARRWVRIAENLERLAAGLPLLNLVRAPVAR